MPRTDTVTIARRPFQGITQIVRYNWPYYILSLGTIAACVAAAIAFNGSMLVQAVFAAGAALAVFWLASSIVVSLYVYDVSPLYRWNWMHEVLPDAPRNWINHHAGLDETSDAIRNLFPGTEGRTLDFYDSSRMKERSIERARRRTENQAEGTVDLLALPLQNSSCDAIFLILAAHEIRGRTDRDGFFVELRRVLRPGGRLILVEHLRDGWNFAAYGPGVRHFFARNEWLRTTTSAGFEMRDERAITPFVRCFVLDRGDRR